MSKLTETSLLERGDDVTSAQVAVETKVVVNERLVNRMSRRNFFASAGVAAGALAVAGCGSSSTPTPTPTSSAMVTVPDVLNFALNLEYLEASFYLYIATGTGLQPADMGTSPGAVSGQSVSVQFTDPNVKALAMQLATEEQAHVQFLRAALTAAGATPIDMPALNLAALGSVTNDATFLAMARQLETVGTSAYEGAIADLVSNTATLTAAAQIHDAEGQHEGTLRQFCIAKGITSAAVDANDIPPTASAVFNTNPMTGLNTARTPSQVLQIVYAAAGQTGVTKGGFFPNGVNGAITST